MVELFLNKVLLFSTDQHILEKKVHSLWYYFTQKLLPTAFVKGIQNTRLLESLNFVK